MRRDDCFNRDKEMNRLVGGVATTCRKSRNAERNRECEEDSRITGKIHMWQKLRRRPAASFAQILRRGQAVAVGVVLAHLVHGALPGEEGVRGRFGVLEELDDVPKPAGGDAQ